MYQLLLQGEIPQIYSNLKFLGIKKEVDAKCIKCPRGADILSIPLRHKLTNNPIVKKGILLVEVFVAFKSIAKDPLQYKDISNMKWKK